jgi:colicin import membrane protein
MIEASTAIKWQELPFLFDRRVLWQVCDRIFPAAHKEGGLRGRRLGHGKRSLGPPPIGAYELVLGDSALKIGEGNEGLIIGLTSNRKRNIIPITTYIIRPGKKHMDINPESRERILNAAHQLFEQSGRKDLPTVDAVRRVSKTSMNDASAVMKEWRRMQIVTASATVVSVPDRVQQAGQSAISTLWTEAQELANDALNVAQAAWDAERSEAEKLRVELSSAFEAQGAELEVLREKLAEVEKQAAASAAAAELEREDTRRQVSSLTDQAHTAMARAQEIEKRAEDLKTALNSAQSSVGSLTAEVEAERKQHGAARARVEALTTELVTVKARAEAQASVQIDQADRLKRVEADLTQARAAAATAREEAAQLRGRAEALKAQHAELMDALKLRESGRSPPKDGKR